MQIKLISLTKVDHQDSLGKPDKQHLGNDPLFTTLHTQEWKVLNKQRIWIDFDGRIRVFSYPKTLQSQMQALPRKYLTWPLNENVSLLLSQTRTPDDACSDDNSHRGVVDTMTNPDTCGSANWI